MLQLTTAPPYSAVEPVTEILHGVSITDPYRWLEDQESPRTREWLAAQTQYARAYLDALAGRKRIRERIRELLDVETYDSLQKTGNRYVFRKRLRGQEQPCIYSREGLDGQDQLLVDPRARTTGKYAAVKPLCMSPGGKILLYEVKNGGERTGTFELMDIERCVLLPDVLPRGNLRGFAFAPDGEGFYYVLEASGSGRLRDHAVRHHVLGTDVVDDRVVFRVEGSATMRLFVFSGSRQLGFLVYRFLDQMYTDFYLWPLNSSKAPAAVLTNRPLRFEPLLLDDRILALTDDQAPNFRIVELRLGQDQGTPTLAEIIPEREHRISQWAVAGDCIFVAYSRQGATEVHSFDLTGRKTGEVPVGRHETIRFAGTVFQNELLFEAESFSEPVGLFRYPLESRLRTLFVRRTVPFDSSNCTLVNVWFTSNDGTQVPMSIVGRRELLDSGPHPIVLTSYGGYGVPVTAQFSIFAAFLWERGCLFALPGIRGGSEFGSQWHDAARRRNRNVAVDDFLCAAEWLIHTGRTAAEKLAAVGASNAGLLVGAAITARPELFRAAICMVPLFDLLRYHLFDDARIRIDEYGAADDPDDFAALLKYSPYHRVVPGAAYPATMIVYGALDTNCNPLHARKMTARMQQATISPYPIILDYHTYRGHSPALPLSDRVDALSDRLAFLCDQLGLTI